MVKSVVFLVVLACFWIRFAVVGEANGGKFEFLALFSVVCIYHDRFRVLGIGGDGGEEWASS